ncbi:ABC transporter permease [Corynebacterium auris]|uniref:ABC transporter permease n=1 Tax=Corynebacterium auris TaxID=44750 RepID=UPI0025B3D75B|nr:ABC transporter permease [Corynebacterium auris]WJY66959.1 Bicarbonate transport system permease protein CmpB [Corynebacterium auris]
MLADNRWRLRGVQLSVLVALIAIWWAITHFSQISPVILPSPVDVARQLVETNLCQEHGEGSARRTCGVQGYFLWQHLLATVQRVAVGFGAGIIFGVVLGWLLASNRVVRAIIEPYVSFMRALPPLGYIGLLIVWFGIGDTSKVILLFLATFPAVTVATTSGVIGVRHDWVRAAQSMGANRAQVLQRVTIPGALPEILSGMRLANGMAWSAIIAAELNDGIPGIGALAFISGTQLNTSLTIASIIVIGVVAVGMDQLFLYAERRWAPWRGKG